VKLEIGGIAPYDGEYDLDFDGAPFTNREWHTIKQLSGVRAGEFLDSLAAGDNDLVVALAVIACQRSGRFSIVQADPFWDATTGRIKVDVEEPEADAGPPARKPADEQRSSNGMSGPSGSPSSVRGGDRLEIVPSPTGFPSSAPSVISAPATSAS